jgi:hypothetical protein
MVRKPVAFTRISNIAHILRVCLSRILSRITLGLVRHKALWVFHRHSRALLSYRSLPD